MKEVGREAQQRHSDRAENTVIFFGHARLPQSLSPPTSSAVVTIEIEVDIDSGRVVSAATNGLTATAESLLCSLLRQRKLDEDLPQVLDELKRRYVGMPQKATCTALLSAYDNYRRHTHPDASHLNNRGRWAIS